MYQVSKQALQEKVTKYKSDNIKIKTGSYISPRITMVFLYPLTFNLKSLQFAWSKEKELVRIASEKLILNELSILKSAKETKTLQIDTAKAMKQLVTV